jgi:hypothetical protein
LAQKDLNVNDDWTLAQTLFGVTTYYRREEDDSLSIKLEGRLEGVPLFEQVAILREVDLHYKWAPFVSSSLTIAHLDKLDTVGWFVVGLPHFGLMRDGCFRAIGCDCIAEDGSILLVGQGIADRPDDAKKDIHSNDMGGDRYLANDPVLKELDLPEVPTRMGSGRMTIRKFQAVIHIDSPTSARTRLIANVDPNLSFMPQSLLEFVMKKLCGVLLAKLQSAAKRIPKDPVRNAHARKMRLERDFYQSWLMAKFQATCDVRGWAMPPVSAFHLTPQQVEQAQAYEESQQSKGAAKMFHSLDNLDKKDKHVLQTASSDPSPFRSSRSVGGGYPMSPAHHLLGESDTVSALSLNSSTTMSTAWLNNPIAAYLKDLEEKTQSRKDEEISKARDRAAKRLRPKILDPIKQARLTELRAAKERRRILEMDDRKTPTSNGVIAGSGGGFVGSSSTSLAGLTTSAVNELDSNNNENGSDSSSICSNGDSNSKSKGGRASPMELPEYPSDAQKQLFEERKRRDLAIVWTQHAVSMRLLVTSTLVAMLFSALYKDSLFGYTPREVLFAPHTDDMAGPWYMGMARDAGTIGYMSAVALIHACLCYVSLMYAFSALQLGTMAGRRAKKFYSEKVHLMVLLASGSMVLLGVVKAFLLVLIRASVWRTVWLAGIVRDLLTHGNQQLLGQLAVVAKNPAGKIVLDAVTPIWKLVESIFGQVIPLMHHVFLTMWKAIFLTGALFRRIALESNSVGKLIERLTLAAYGGGAHYYLSWNRFVNDVVDRNEGRLEMHSWREDAFNTTRTLLSYSAIFLLTLLFLFNLSAQQGRSSALPPASRLEGEAESASRSSLSGSNPSSKNPVSKSENKKESRKESKKESSKDKGSSQSSIPVSIPRSAPMRARVHTFDAIEEEPSIVNEAKEDKGIADAVPETSRSAATSSKKKKRGFGFRLGRRKRITNEKDGDSESRRRTHSL